MTFTFISLRTDSKQQTRKNSISSGRDKSTTYIIIEYTREKNICKRNQIVQRSISGSIP